MLLRYSGYYGDQEAQTGLGDFQDNNFCNPPMTASSPACPAPTSALGLALKPYLTVPEVRQLLPLSKGTIYQLIRNGTLPSVKLPGVDKILIRQADLLCYMESAK